MEINIEDLIKKAHEKITRIKGREYAPNIHEIQSEIDKLIQNCKQENN